MHSSGQRLIIASSLGIEEEYQILFDENFDRHRTDKKKIGEDTYQYFCDSDGTMNTINTC